MHNYNCYYCDKCYHGNLYLYMCIKLINFLTLGFLIYSPPLNMHLPTSARDFSHTLKMI